MSAAIREFVGSKRDGSPKFGLSVRKLESCRHYANHSVAFRVEGNCFTEDARIAAKAPLPEPLAEDRDLVPAMYSQLLISADDYEERPRVIDDCLQFVGR